MNRCLSEATSAGAEQAKFAIGPKAPVLDPTVKEIVFAGDPETIDGNRFHMSVCHLLCKFVSLWCRLDRARNLFGKFSTNFLVGIKRKHILATGFINRRIFLCGIAFPLLD